MTYSASGNERKSIMTLTPRSFSRARLEEMTQAELAKLITRDNVHHDVRVEALAVFQERVTYPDDLVNEFELREGR
jgi:hypothetical protein